MARVKKENDAFIAIVFILIALLLLLSICGVFFATKAHALLRCKQYSHDVKRYHNIYFGIDFPSEYSIAQLHAESLCRNHILSSDGIGSEGLAQITFRLWKRQLEDEGIHEIGTISNHLRAQAYINKKAYDTAACKKLWVTYQIYNGGTLVNKEIARAGSCEHEKSYAACKRKDIVFGNGQRRNACDINYEYSVRIFDLAGQYRFFDKNSGYEYW